MKSNLQNGILTFFILSVILLFITGCYDLNNPVDPNGTAYQGFPVYKDGSIPEDAVITVAGVSPKTLSSIFDTTPLLDWVSIDNAKGYQIQISETEAGLSEAALISMNESQYKVPLANIFEYGKTYNWRIRVANGENIFSPWSEVHNFVIEVIWSGRSPSNGGTTIDTTPLLNWDDVRGADGYKVRYANSSGELAASTVHDVSASEYPINVVQTLDSSVYWQVLAVNEDGVSSVWSEIYDITVEPLVSMISIIGGSFIMGDTWGDGVSNELPTHSVTLSDFFIGRYEVTYDEWEEVYNWAILNGYNFANIGQAGNGGGDTNNEPVTIINWRDVIVWCNAASEYTDLSPVYTYTGNVIKDSRDTNSIACDNAVPDWSSNGYRLPSEAEWEYAAKGGDMDINSGKYAGSSILGDVAWYSDNSGGDTHPVGEKQENELGLNDMTGNVLEWCWDWYGSTYYTSSPALDPHGPSSGTQRVFRGGTWFHSEIGCRIAYRNFDNPYIEGHTVGFRLVFNNL